MAMEPRDGTKAVETLLLKSYQLVIW